ncbi:hypothetical protein LTR53_008600 [Teratosphaeriaceae sp. CCFEE 6253]|nr:hypothetical protein LTR53_008600 [Teratosphaeriaceae sp. CCFEE 6253]
MSDDAGPRRIEEQTLSRYRQKTYYPVRIGDVYNDRYRVIAKIGFGAYSTVWLARDQRSKAYSCLKVCVHDDTEASPILNEVRMLRHLEEMAKEDTDDHPGLDFTRLADEIFQIEGPAEQHYCMASKPQGVSIRALQDTYPNAILPKLLVKSLIFRLLAAVNFLHAQAGVIHTDISPANVLTKAEDDTDFQLIEAAESQHPDTPVLDGEYPVYRSREAPTVVVGYPYLTDFGTARLADPINTGWCMPDLYRAPEILLGLPWSFPVDVWSIGVITLQLLEGRNVFYATDPRDRKYVLPLALAQYISYMGLPPPEMIQKSPSCQRYFDENGEWSEADCPIPLTCLEEFVTIIPPGEEKDLFLKFIRKMLTWDPEPRSTSNELLVDEWLTLRT